MIIWGWGVAVHDECDIQWRFNVGTISQMIIPTPIDSIVHMLNKVDAL